MGRLDTLEEMVRAELVKNPRARNCDRELTLGVWTNYFGINPWAPIIEVMRNKELPGQESLGRIRRKIQESDEKLRGTKYREKVRIEAQRDYLDYVKE